MNKVVLAFAVTALVTAAFSPLDAREFKHSGCAKAAEIKFPTDHIALVGGLNESLIAG